MIRERPPKDASVCPRSKRSKPRTLCPRLASWYAAALPCAPRPTTMTSKTRSLTTRSAGDGHRDDARDLLGPLAPGLHSFDAAVLKPTPDRVLDRAAGLTLTEV